MNKKLYNLLKFSVLAIENRLFELLKSCKSDFRISYLGGSTMTEGKSQADYERDRRRWGLFLYGFQNHTRMPDLTGTIQLDLFETSNIRLDCPYRLNQKNWKPTSRLFAKARKRVETNFSQLTDQYMVMRNYAKRTAGLFARIIGKISAQTIAQYFNYINNKPIGRVKYALI